MEHAVISYPRRKKLILPLRAARRNLYFISSRRASEQFNPHADGSNQ